MEKKGKTGSIIIAAIAAVTVGVLAFSRAAAVESVYPAERAGRIFVRRVWHRVVGVFKGAEAKAENASLKREVASLALARSELERVEAENARLRKALGYVERNAGRWLPAEVIVRHAPSPGFRVARGSLDGVKVGAVVMVPEGLVGRVSSVTAHTAEVTTLAEGSIKVAAEIDGSRARGMLAGDGEGRLVIRHLKNASEVSARSRVLTSGLGGVFPKGIAIGTLLEIRKDGKESTDSGEVLPDVDYMALEDVFIRSED